MTTPAPAPRTAGPSGRLNGRPTLPRPVLGEPVWRSDAQCRKDNAGFFFAPPHFERKDEKDAREGQARALCRACPVQRECLDYALDVQEPHGIWGGMNELERRRHLRKTAVVRQQSA